MSYRFTNWGRNYTSDATALRKPRSTREVIDIVGRARAYGTVIRPVGAGHSWSSLVCTNGIILSLDHMDRVIEVDHERHRVRLQAGKRLKHINEELAAMGLGLSNLGSVSEQSIAGATATGTHGTGITFGVIASAIRSMTLVNGKGEVVQFNEDDPKLNAARVALGALGIVTEIEMQVEPAFNLEETVWKLPFDEALRQMPELLDQHEHIKFWWMPHTDFVACYAMNRTDKPANPPSRVTEFVEGFLNDYVFEGILAAGRTAPGIIPPMNALVADSYFKEGTRVDRSDRVFNLPMPPIHLEEEYGIPAEYASEMLSRVRNMVIRENLKVSFIQEIRFVEADEIWLSNAFGRRSCQFGAYMADGPGSDVFFREVARIAADYEGRPHWGKDFRHTRDELAALYPKYEDFEKLRREMDPDGVFANSLISRSFG